MVDPLYAGSFSSVPVRLHDYGGGKYAFLDAEGNNCWTDPAHRVLLYRLTDVDRVLQAHGFRRDLLMRIERIEGAPRKGATP